MSKTKLIDNNRRTHSAKVLAQPSKKQKTHEEASDHSKDTSRQILEQYRIIRKDVLKLREDLSQGYDLVKEWIVTKISIRNILRQNS